MEWLNEEWLLNNFWIFFALLWVIALIGISAMGGWRDLAERYTARKPFQGKLYRFKGAQMRWLTNYGGCLNIGANTEGLYMSLLFPFRIGHPPLFIPWRDIQTGKSSGMVVPRIELNIGKPPGIPMKINRYLASELAARSGGNLTIE